MNYEDLKKYCSIIYGIVGEKSISNEKITNSVVSNYYLKSAFFYRNAHSPEGAMHLPIEFSNKDSHKSKLLYQADYIHKIINENKFTNVLELGCGMGFNTNHLAKKNPEVSFTGIDLTANNIKIAKEKNRELENAQFSQGDFDKLDLSDKKYDLIFAVETLCYSQNLANLISELGNNLNENGRIIIFDGYEKHDVDELSKEYEKKAYQILSWGFALSNFQNMGDILESEKLKSYSIIEPVEYTENILPNYKTFQRGAERALRYKFSLKILFKFRIISLALIKQLSAGLLGAYFFNNGFLGYFKLEFIKK